MLTVSPNAEEDTEIGTEASLSNDFIATTSDEDDTTSDEDDSLGVH